MGRAGRVITRIPLAVNPPPIITPRDMAAGCAITDATRDTAQIMAPIIQRQILIMVFNSDLP